ncbi:Lipopolysaccharide-induced tumor necrosis factor-alpha factor [Schistosoma japonicum]|uniref:Lipopolysaccharide-induced tumor necrosis factor-alpha factor n=1 Tax=Schistosoma japonicum TaxID=6182 RepID=C1LKS8_SCHJA|nr:Cell death-inducing p53-target protein 1 like [Schistosoma japonicum]TNN14226.1 Lipopolysaccharide-induced tumor necrosis factor-alpha factor [Schistosoma japonicum]CAX75306.1 Lipopolysaccharide-induced tumor necrosis factor-alpha factor homolog [Schistosoma japonicum]CAX75307.1 Lipopolysaccharide-induced tumor necrosis factor-alpha factor homolog [Schistosoma japonicum]CAX75308.1 Lipopolysaccharide-induced tumor necrosis factor-alpha factor homolog [Schistosoma japonicum]
MMNPSAPYPDNSSIPVTIQVMPRQPLRDKPVYITCPLCKFNITTSLFYHNGILTFTACVCLAVFGCDLGCCLIPFLCKACKNVEHRCPNCQGSIDTFDRISDCMSAID